MQVSDLPPLETHLAWIAKVSRVDRCSSICITGGEPFVYFQRLLKIVDGCRNHGLRATVFTSAHWATSDEIAALRLQQLAAAGLTGIAVQTSTIRRVFHWQTLQECSVCPRNVALPPESS
jgi:organic radical activating enzyme